MKTLLLMATVLAFAPHSDEKERLNIWLDERIKAHREYLKKDMQDAEDPSAFAWLDTLSVEEKKF